MTTYHVFGDTGGHADQLRNGLIAIGLDEKTFKLPAATKVIHCGDLIHKGPDSLGVLTLVDSIMEANPGRWIQLLGNHEFQYLRGAPQFWRQIIPVDGQYILQSWLAKGRVKVAHGLPEGVKFHRLTESAREFLVPSKGVVFTHGGITHRFWSTVLDKELDSLAVANRINELPIRTVTAPGEMLTGWPGGDKLPVGPVWASGVGEVWASWFASQEPMPFIQVHGHTTAYDFSQNRWNTSLKDFRRASRVNPTRRTTLVEVAESLQVGVDPGYNTLADGEAQPALKLESDY